MRVSVIVTAFDRREYLEHAIQSVLNQSIDRSRYEIIVVSNFTFNLIGFPSDAEITTIVMNGSVGEFLFAGIKAAKYEIISFLDDDDVFEPDKLQRLIDVFSLSPQLSYYHNGVRYVDSGLRPITHFRLVEKKMQPLKDIIIVIDPKKKLNMIRKALEYNGDFNLSSIAIKKECSEKYMSTLRGINGLTDGFFFWSSLAINGQIMIESKKLTNYRMHEENTSAQIDFHRKVLSLEEQIHTFKLILDFLDDKCSPNRRSVYLKGWVNLYKCEYELISLVFANSSRVTILKQIKKLSSVDMRFSNALKYRIFFFAIIALIRVKYAQKFYLIIRSSIV